MLHVPRAKPSDRSRWKIGLQTGAKGKEWKNKHRRPLELLPVAATAIAFAFNQSLRGAIWSPAFGNILAIRTISLSSGANFVTISFAMTSPTSVSCA